MENSLGKITRYWREMSYRSSITKLCLLIENCVPFILFVDYVFGFSLV
jgi:hypothetical protein